MSKKFEKEIGPADSKYVMKYLYWKNGGLPFLAFIKNLSIEFPNLDWWAGGSVWK